MEQTTPRQAPPSAPAVALLNIERVRELTSFSTSHIYAQMAAGKFPAPLKLGRKCVRWRSGDVMAYLEALA